MTTVQQQQHHQQQQQQQTIPIHKPQSPVHVDSFPHEKGTTDRQPARVSPLCHLGPNVQITNNNNSSIKKKKKSVRIKSTVTVVPVRPLSSGMDEHEKSTNLYYTRRDMERFSQQVTAVHHQFQDIRPRITAEQCLAVEELRGLERQVCPEIARNRAVAARTVLSYQRRLRECRRQSDAFLSISSEDEEVKNITSASTDDMAVRLGAISAKLSRWSRDVALERARADFLGAYSHLVPGGLGAFRPKVIEPFPSLSFKKRTQFVRQVSDLEDNHGILSNEGDCSSSGPLKKRQRLCSNSTK